LNHIYMNQANNDNFHQNLKTILGDNNMHLSSNMTMEKVGDLLSNMCFTLQNNSLQNNSCNNIPKCVVGYCTLNPTRAPK
jgi:hypothetical protein